MQNFKEIQELVKAIDSSERVLNQIKESKYSQHNGL